MTAGRSTICLKRIARTDFRTGVAEGGITLCIAQLKRDTASIAGDLRSDANLAAVRQLLDTENPESLVQHVASGRVTLLQCPEYAFGSADWHDLDALVRCYPEPLILCAGFGLAQAAAVDAIVARPDVTAGWSDRCPLKTGFRYNFGAIWLHTGSHRNDDEATHCYLFGKTVPEQVHERPCNPYPFSEHLGINLADLTLWPFICAEAINQQNGGGLNAAICSHLRSATSPSLVLGLLRQGNGQDDLRWSEGISALARASGNGQSTVVIANTATERVANVDRPARNLTGVYAAFGTRAAPSGPGKTIQSHEYGLEAWRIRVAEPCVMLGILQMGAHAANSALHHYFPDHAWIVGSDGTLRPEHRGPLGLELSAAADSELFRFEQDDVRTAVSHRLADTLDKHRPGAPCRIDTVATAWLQGPLRHTRTAHNYDANDAGYLPELCRCIRALGGLMNMPGNNPGLEPGFSVPERCQDVLNPAIGTLESVPVWLWIDLERDRNDMVAELTKQLNEGLHHPGTMLILGRARKSEFLNQPLSESASATQITQPRPHPSPSERQDLPNATPRSNTRKVRLMGIDSLGVLWERDMRKPVHAQFQQDEMAAIRRQLKES